MTRDLKYMNQRMKNVVRTIFLVVALFTGATGEVRADDINQGNIKINSVSNGTITTKSVAGRTVTITVTPNTDYFINRSDIKVQKLVDPSSATRTTAPEIADYLSVSGPDRVLGSDSKDFTFTIPEGYHGALIDATFRSQNDLVYLDGTNRITDLAKTYILKTDVGPDIVENLPEGDFVGELDGEYNGVYHKIIGLTKPLFASTKNATIKNVMFTDVNINITTSGTNVGAITGEAKGTTRIYNCGILSGSVSGTKYVGGLVGLLDGNSTDGYARVINCFSYASVGGGTDVGGLVGYNNGTTNAASITTMVMNCMFYGDITSGTRVSPVYGGNNISNLNTENQNTMGLNTFNYYAYDEATTFKGYPENSNKKYNCAQAVEEKYLNRIEFYRLLLNSNRKLAAYYATGEAANADQMAKWVLETADRENSDPKPYPVLKAQGKYPSIINIDADHATQLTLENGKPSEADRKKGGKIGTLSVTISESNTTNGGQTKPTGATVETTSLNLNRTDMDENRFNFNYDKVQLPYYNDVGTKNYTGNKVVTGWKITAIDEIANDPYTSSNYPTSGVKDYPDHNYADRKSSKKDLYSVSGRVFSQGAYFDVPYGVGSITIEPYWGNAAYVADEYMDVVSKKGSVSGRDTYITANVEKLGKQFASGKITINGSEQTVYTSISSAIGTGSPLTGSEVYDNAVVLVGNLHQIGVPSGGSKKFTMMSVDLDKDNEPDYSLIYCDNNRNVVCPIRFDFLNIPGMAHAQKPNGANRLLNAAIFKTRGWFEITNTALIYFTQFEYENQDGVTKEKAPLILLGGYIDQFVSTQKNAVSGNTIYIHVGDNVLINSFGLGTHSDGSYSTPHVPVSVTGGDFKEFYLTGTYNQNAAISDDNAECYISGGRFGELAGAAQEQIGTDNSANKGNIHWQIYDADITSFYGGGINDAKPVQGNITTDIFNSHVTTFCGGPKFGNMASGKIVKTTAYGCVFDNFFGAGYGGNSYSRKKYFDGTSYTWTSLHNYYLNDRGKYYDGTTTNSKNGGGDDAQYGKKGPGVATDFDYEFFVWTSGQVGLRFFVKFVSFSLAQCNDVNSTLTGCTINGNFYGGGSLGKVTGTATSILEDCTLKGNVFGAGYSATMPDIKVRTSSTSTNPNVNYSSGMFEPGVPANPTANDMTGTNDFSWKQKGSYPSNGNVGFIDNNDEYNLNGNNVVTVVDISHTNLGSVGSVDLKLKGNTTVSGSVYGGGDQSTVNGAAPLGNTIVTLMGNTQVNGDVFGGGNNGIVSGSTTVNIEE